MEYNKERIMLIVWKWRDFEKKENGIIQSELLEIPEFQDVIKSPEKYKDQLFDEFEVCDILPNGTLKPVSPSAKIVRTRINKSIDNHDDPTISYLINLIDYYTIKDNSIFVFLHRIDGFGDKEVEMIIDKSKASRCFLIGGGRDFIYRNTQNEGLLDDLGRFYRSVSRANRPAVMIADEKNKKVFQPHFDKVWSYYFNEFYNKIYEFKEDYLSHFYRIYPDDQTLEQIDFSKFLKNDNALFLRAKSFIDNEYGCLEYNERRLLMQIEKKEQKSYIFDDLRANLAIEQDIQKEYDEASKLIEPFFISNKLDLKKYTIRNYLFELNQRFEKLLEKIN